MRVPPRMGRRPLPSWMIRSAAPIPNRPAPARRLRPAGRRWQRRPLAGDATGSGAARAWRLGPGLCGFLAVVLVPWARSTAFRRTRPRRADHEEPGMSVNADDRSLRPFRVEIPGAELQDLRDRLGRTRWPDDAPTGGWEYGIPLGYVRELAEYWRTAYDWRKHEARLNELPQYTTMVDRQKLHFLHVRSPEPDALPLIITHGWPGSVVEFLDVIGPLTDPRRHGGAGADAFHVVAPSIPGFGFSGPTTEPGWDVKRVAAAFAELMRRLGYQRYGAQGGDWGSAISRQLGLIDPEHVVGVHLNMLGTPPSIAPEEMAQLTEREQAYVAAAARFLWGSKIPAVQAAPAAAIMACDSRVSASPGR